MSLSVSQILKVIVSPERESCTGISHNDLPISSEAIVTPFQVACFNWAGILAGLPGLLARSIIEIVSPLNISIHSKRELFCFVSSTSSSYDVFLSLPNLFSSYLIFPWLIICLQFHSPINSRVTKGVTLHPDALRKSDFPFKQAPHIIMVTSKYEEFALLPTG